MLSERKTRAHNQIFQQFSMFSETISSPVGGMKFSSPENINTDPEKLYVRKVHKLESMELPESFQSSDVKS